MTVPNTLPDILSPRKIIFKFNNLFSRYNSETHNSVLCPECFIHNNLPLGGFNPSEKYESKWESSPGRGENKKYLKPPPSYVSMIICGQTSAKEISKTKPTKPPGKGGSKAPTVVQDFSTNNSTGYIAPPRNPRHV